MPSRTQRDELDLCIVNIGNVDRLSKYQMLHNSRDTSNSYSTPLAIMVLSAPHGEAAVLPSTNLNYSATTESNGTRATDGSDTAALAQGGATAGA